MRARTQQAWTLVATVALGGCVADEDMAAATIIRFDGGRPGVDSDGGTGTPTQVDGEADGGVTDPPTGNPSNGGTSAEALFADPTRVGTDCSQLDRDHLIWEVQMGGAVRGALLNLHRETGELLASCGALAVSGQPTETRFMPWALTDAGTVFYQLGASVAGMGSQVAIMEEEPLAECTTNNCFTYEGFEENDRMLFPDYDPNDHLGDLEFSPARFFYNPGNDTVHWPATETFAGLTLDGEGQPVDYDPEIEDTRLAVFGPDGSRLTFVEAFNGGFTFHVKRDGQPLVSDEQHHDGLRIASAIGVEDGFRVAIMERDAMSSYLISVDLDGTTTRLGDYPLDADPQWMAAPRGGRLMPWDECLYTAVVDFNNDNPTITRRCIDGTYEAFFRTGPCITTLNYCIL